MLAHSKMTKMMALATTVLQAAQTAEASIFLAKPRKLNNSNTAPKLTIKTCNRGAAQSFHQTTILIGSASDPSQNFEVVHTFTENNKLYEWTFPVEEHGNYNANLVSYVQIQHPNLNAVCIDSVTWEDSANLISQVVPAGNYGFWLDNPCDGGYPRGTSCLGTEATFQLPTNEVATTTAAPVVGNLIVQTCDRPAAKSGKTTVIETSNGQSLTHIFEESNTAYGFELATDGVMWIRFIQANTNAICITSVTWMGSENLISENFWLDQQSVEEPCDGAYGPQGDETCHGATFKLCLPGFGDETCDGSGVLTTGSPTTTTTTYGCPSGFAFVGRNLDGSDKIWAPVDSTRTIQECGQICKNRVGCTGFEFFAGEGVFHGFCGTYTNGAANIQANSNPAGWWSCLVSDETEAPATAAPQTTAGPQCAHQTPTLFDNVLECLSGAMCNASTDPLGWSCCVPHGGRARCPSNYQQMCARKNCAAGGSDYCCYQSCDTDFLQGQRSCDTETTTAAPTATGTTVVPPTTTTTAAPFAESNCPAGYVEILQNLKGKGKQWATPDTSRTITECADICNARNGCTSFEFFTGPGKWTGHCGTYTAGDANIHWQLQHKNWHSCVKDGVDTSSAVLVLANQRIEQGFEVHDTVLEMETSAKNEVETVEALETELEQAMLAEQAELEAMASKAAGTTATNERTGPSMVASDASRVRKEAFTTVVVAIALACAFAL